MLLHSRDELLFVLEDNWALVGWELQRAETNVELRKALRRAEGIRCRGLEIFCLDYRRETTFAQLQAARDWLQIVLGRLRQAQRDWEKCKNSVELAQSALNLESIGQKREVLCPSCEELETALARTYAKFSQLQIRLMRLQEVIRRREASFAQSQLLDFIESDRYASTPLNFANAMAGLPSIHWRQSMNRCQQFEDGSHERFTYRRFLIVTAVIKTSAKCADDAVERMRTRLVKAKSRDVVTLNGLAENWHFLRLAIRSVFEAERSEGEALPYRIFAEYQRRVRCQGPADILRAEREIITTPAYLKQRLRANRR